MPRQGWLNCSYICRGHLRVERGCWMVRRRFTVREEEQQKATWPQERLTERTSLTPPAGLTHQHMRGGTQRYTSETIPQVTETHENQRLLQNDKIQGANRIDGLNGVHDFHMILKPATNCLIFYSFLLLHSTHSTSGFLHPFVKSSALQFYSNCI